MREAGGEVEVADVLPPCVEVIDHQLHHEVLGPGLFEVVLEDEAGGPDPEDGDLAIEQGGKAEGLVEGLAEGEVLGGEEGAGEVGGGGGHGVYCTTCSDTVSDPAGSSWTVLFRGSCNTAGFVFAILSRVATESRISAR